VPWQPVEIGALANHLATSTSHGADCTVVGVGPKAVQRTLRFQGFLALAQGSATPSGRRGAAVLAGIAVDVGYADHATACG
jgi:hypothetical protein